MKKLNLLFAFVVVVTSMFAQEPLTSKKGEAYLPAAGEWAISIDASPFLDYAGNFIGGDGLNMAPTFDPLFNQRIIGKYFTSATEAYRGGIRLGFNSSPKYAGVPVIPAVTPTEYVNNTTTASTTNIGLTGGKEWRKGSTRLQGFYGGEAGIGFTSVSNGFKNGNAITTTNRVVNFTSTNGTFQLGLRAFIGAEYFLLPKMSIGGEFGWGLTLKHGM